jgi:hypothetical protein
VANKRFYKQINNNIMTTDIRIDVIPSRYNMFWWEAVLMCDGKVLKSLGQFRTEEKANKFIEEAFVEHTSLLQHRQASSGRSNQAIF